MYLKQIKIEKIVHTVSLVPNTGVFANCWQSLTSDYDAYFFLSGKAHNSDVQFDFDIFSSKN